MDERVLTEEELLKKEKNKLRKERQKRRKYRLLLLLLLMGGTGVMLTTSTYAWFTANRNVAIQDLQVNVSASDGIQISADASNWKSIVQTDDLLNAKYDSSLDGTAPNANQLPAALVPVSTIGAVNDKGFLDMYLGTLAVSKEAPNIGSYIVTATQIPPETKRQEGEYIAFDLFFKVQKQTQIHLNTGSGVTDTNDIKGIQNAARIAFVTEGNKPAGTPLPEIQGVKLGASASKPAGVYMWEPNFDVHTAAAVANGKGAYEIPDIAEKYKKISYSGVKAPVGEDLNILRKNATQTAHGDQFGDVAIDLATEADYATKQPIITLSAGITKVRVYLWIEGQDVDCEDTASGGNIKFTLSISSLAEGVSA